MDDDDADYMQGSDDEVCTRRLLPLLVIDTTFIRIMASITLMTGTAMRGRVRMSRTCTTPPSVCRFSFAVAIFSPQRVAKKEDDPEQALKEFKAIVDKEEEKGDWYTILLCYHPRMTDWTGKGDSRHSNSRQNCCSWSSSDQTRPLRRIANC